MKVAIASDLSGFPLKQAVVKHLREKNYEIIDFGIPNEQEAQPYVVQAPKVAKAIQKGEADCGILICGTGQGMAMVANKHKGIRACVAYDVFAGERARSVNDANIITMGGWIIAPYVGCEIAEAYLTSHFAKKLESRKEFLASSLATLRGIEEENFK